MVFAVQGAEGLEQAIGHAHVKADAVVAHRVDLQMGAQVFNDPETSAIRVFYPQQYPVCMVASAAYEWCAVTYRARTPSTPHTAIRVMPSTVHTSGVWPKASQPARVAKPIWVYM